MAAGYLDFTAGAVLSAANLEDYCEAQSVMRFATTGARDAALVTIKTNGMTCYVTATSEFYVYDGAAWVAFSSRYVPVAGGLTIVNTTTAGVVTATPTDIAWGTEFSDPDNWHAAASATIIVPAGKAGRYLVTYQGRWSAAPGTSPGIACLISGTGTYEASVGSSPAFTYWVQTITFMRTMAVGDTIKFTAYQNSGSARDLVSSVEIAPV